MDKTGLVILIATAFVAVVALLGFLVMIWLGVVYSLFNVLAPIGYWEALGLGLITTVTLNAISPGAVTRKAS